MREKAALFSGGEAMRGPASDMGGGPAEAHDFMGMMLRAQPHVLVQTQAALLTGADSQQARGDRAEHPGFALRRARFGFSGEAMGRLSYGLYGEMANNPQSNAGPLSEAWLGITAWRGAQVVIGAHRTPFSQSAMLGSGGLALIERPLAVGAMSPFRQVGITLSGHYPQLAGLQWYVGAYNAFERGINFHEGFREFAGLNGNKFGGVAGVGRLAVAPWGDMGRETFDATGGSLRAQLGASYYHSDASTVVMDGLAADLHVKVQGFHLLVEYLQDNAEPKDRPTLPATISSTMKRRALLAEAGYHWRRLNAAVRFENVDPDVSRDNDSDEQVLSAALGMQAPGQKLRLQLQFDHRHERPAVDNDTLFAQFQLQL